VEKIANSLTDYRLEVFKLAAGRKGLPESSIEKDFWVCWVLDRLFKDPELSKILLFKGGTTLSKCFGLIERFSEDIDLIVDWNEVTDEDPWQDRSNRQQDIFNKKMEADTHTYIRESMLQKIAAALSPLCKVQIHPQRPRSILVSYPRAVESEYLKPEIELEIGPMSSMTPNSRYEIEAYCAQEIPKAFEQPKVRVDAIAAKKTFWDKVTILHVEAHRPDGKQQPQRYSRHYYDLYQMINSTVRQEALDDLPLLDDVINFKWKFYPQGWANYQGAAEGEFKLLPSQQMRKFLQKDYAQMKEMIFGSYPDFEDILSVIEEFQKELNALER